MLLPQNQEIKKHVAIDLHRRNFLMKAVDFSTGECREKRYINNIDNIRKFASTVNKEWNIVIEATQGSSLIYDILSPVVNKVSIANSTRIRLISDSYKKTDENDVDILLELSALDRIPEVYVPPREHREIWKIIKYRDHLTGTKTAKKNMVHGILGAEGYQNEYSDLFGKKGREYLKGLKISEHHRWLVELSLKEIENIDKYIETIEERIAAFAIDKPIIQLIMTIPGVGVVLATALYIKIGDIRRFASSDQLAAYFGLVPIVKQSDKTVRRGHISKMGCSIIRSLLIQAVQHVIKSNARLEALYTGVKARSGIAGKAAVAVARKIITIVYAMLIKGQVYREMNNKFVERKIREFVDMAYKGSHFVDPVSLKTKVMRKKKKELRGELFRIVTEQREGSILKNLSETLTGADVPNH